ncbi:MAG: choice-of-anchor D domain-containing protein [Terriglobales bacterium]
MTYPSGFALSQRAADLPIQPAIDVEEQIHEPGPSPLRSRATKDSSQHEDPVLQKEVQPMVSATQGVSFTGIPSPGYVPSDSNMAIGPTDIVEVVNVQFAVYSKSGSVLAGPTNIQSLFAPLGGVCASTFGDPVALYDRPANRWVISFIGSNSGGTIAAECVAVSETSDPTGSYYLYGYSFGSTLNDYPKLSTWATATNSAYLATYNLFANFSNFAGADLCGFDRTKMLTGDPTAAMLCQTTPDSEGSYLPSDMDGPTPPVDGTPGLFITWQNNDPGQLYLRTLALNFAAGTATLGGPTVISTANTTLTCGGNAGDCVPQEGTTQELDTLGDRLMYRFAIRHFADHDRAVVNHAVTSGSQAAIRWYELYDPAGAVTLNQQSTFAPDSTYRWMASLAEDQTQDIGMGYSASSSTIYPAIRFTGRIPTDSVNTMESEATILNGTGSQVGSYAYRWGDYTAMQVDPSDDCTFWYVDQYQAVNGTFDWSTNISSFSFSRCSGSALFTLNANPDPVSVVEASSGTTTVNVVPGNGFGANVTLSASGLPSGVTAAFSPNPTASTSTATFTVAGTVATGTYPVTISGIAGSLNYHTTVQLAVTAPPNAPAVTLSAASLTFVNEVVGGTTAAKSVTLTNSGTGTLNIASITPSGDFAVSSTTCGSTLAVAKKCVIKVTFTPTQVGSRSGAITITDNALNSPQSISLTGTGTVQATLTPATATFTSENVGTASPAKTFTLANKQSVALTGISASASGDFSISPATTCTTSLAAKSSCKISVVFTPSQSGARTGTLQVSDSAVTSPQTSSLTGTGK